MHEKYDHASAKSVDDRWPWCNKMAWSIFAIVTGFYLWIEHRAHILDVLPYLLLLLCPLMHLFMHHGHRHEHGDESPPQDKTHGVGGHA